MTDRMQHVHAGARGGYSRSIAKITAARANGRRGGRPRKSPPLPPPPPKP